MKIFGTFSLLIILALIPLSWVRIKRLSPAGWRLAEDYGREWREAQFELGLDGGEHMVVMDQENGFAIEVEPSLRMPPVRYYRLNNDGTKSRIMPDKGKEYLLDGRPVHCVLGDCRPDGKPCVRIIFGGQWSGARAGIMKGPGLPGMKTAADVPMRTLWPTDSENRLLSSYR